MPLVLWADARAAPVAEAAEEEARRRKRLPPTCALPPLFQTHLAQGDAEGAGPAQFGRNGYRGLPLPPARPCAAAQPQSEGRCLGDQMMRPLPVVVTLEHQAGLPFLISVGLSPLLLRMWVVLPRLRRHHSRICRIWAHHR